MTARLALVTCRQLAEPDDDEEALLAAVRRQGVAVEMAAWDEASVRWQNFDACVIRSTWNYHHHLPRFLEWATQVAAVTHLHNPLPIVRWNSHKKYLLDLTAAGVPVVPTEWVQRGGAAHLANIRDQRGWADLVVKPAVSGGSYQTLRVQDDELERGQQHLEAVLRERDALIQPYLPAVEDHGERAVVVIAGEITHAVRKSPRFIGGVEQVSEAMPVAADERELAERAMAAAGQPLLYGRVDMARDAHGKPCIMELELIEPSLFLLQAPPALERFARAIAAS